MYYTVFGDDMKETIYTIPVNEAFDEKCGCPICRMYNALEKIEIERISGAAMMEPDVRMETNKSGFCKDHFAKLCELGKALPTALMIESHLDHIKKYFEYIPPKKKMNMMASKLRMLNNDCYVCGRVRQFFACELDALFLMLKEEDFKKKFDEAEYFCLPHLELLITYAPSYLKKKECEEFLKKLLDKEKAYFEKLHTDVGDFCKTFDHRFSESDFPNSKGSTTRAITAIIGERE